MISQTPVPPRPPVGFVVEGMGEYNCFPSLVCRLLGVTLNVPRVNAGGFGGITCRLAENLTQLVRIQHPFHVVVTVDLDDVLKAGVCGSCAELLQKLQADVSRWLVQAADNPKLMPLPLDVRIVIQVRKFESWMVAGLPDLTQDGEMRAGLAAVTDFDLEIPSPTKLLLRAPETRARNFKNPEDAKWLISQFDVPRMRQRSKSFDKFCREVRRSYDRWLTATNT